MANGGIKLNQQVSVVMGSISDWETMKPAATILADFGIKFEKKVISAHRMPAEMFSFAQQAADRGIKVIIAGAGGAAHLPGMLAANTTLPVIGVPVKTHALNGMDSLLSIVQMPAGVPVATTAIGVAGAKNAALLAIEILGIENASLIAKLVEFRQSQHDAALESGEKLD
ncbi:5-(carboxyamino)imidazole ribonucleotide mutase [Liquorilactobacillus nagelii]|jgi:5-(carboxyamino)imidazole ribonucleotide mutase|uniref:5-(carboxyamino)imidazole ribonucleotide mutase n=1 Tax=Liquorilactobacillus nagelii TaxID=82688 RepID=UPI0006F0C301|nr:phosphoribosylaminoimidazole carboxylase carboxyltransferase subunit [Liquorilactobacillus nagelii DSM 13675]MCP9314482.1 5-(carboxyamino)imidazole ribonucleotide mutase [Liquorilactobacillus nagelii]